MFFFEKKNQKTFTSLGRAYAERPQPEQSKVFCFFFSKKKTFPFCYRFPNQYPQQVASRDALPPSNGSSDAGVART
jgi:hypothetical protein